jgi:hypothetical protein
LDFAKAHAAALQFSGERAEAAIRYLMAYFMHPEDLELALLGGRCMVELGQLSQAYLTLDSIFKIDRLITRARDREQVKTLRVFIDALKDKLENGEAASARTQKAAGGRPAKKTEKKIYNEQ